MKKRETLNNTLNNSVYNKLVSRERIRRFGLCFLCSEYGGCNSYFHWKGWSQPAKNWKRFRKHQWKD